MLYALLAYHPECVIDALTPVEDDALMAGLHAIHDRLHAQGHLGPAARLGPTRSAKTLRRDQTLAVVDGPFAETKEQLLGFYVLDFPGMDEALAAARDLATVNPSAIYEVRPIILFLPGAGVGTGPAVAEG
jgi:hypothetical protein